MQSNAMQSNPIQCNPIQLNGLPLSKTMFVQGPACMVGTSWTQGECTSPHSTQLHATGLHRISCAWSMRRLPLSSQMNARQRILGTVSESNLSLIGFFNLRGLYRFQSTPSLSNQIKWTPSQDMHWSNVLGHRCRAPMTQGVGAQLMQRCMTRRVGAQLMQRCMTQRVGAQLMQRCMTQHVGAQLMQRCMTQRVGAQLMQRCMTQQPLQIVLHTILNLSSTARCPG
jgi:hypothetical protein